ncbi:MAG: hypothetical protein RL660_683 [Bacteroidota bacterium]|jgi:hypothetical protein
MKCIYTTLLVLFCAVGSLFAQVVPATVTTSASATNACSNSPITYTANVTTSGGAAYPAANIVSYQWYVNGGMVGTNSATYVDPSPTNSDQVYVAVTCNDASGNTATYNSTIFILGSTGATVVPTITITSDAPTSCANNLITFTANTVDAGVTPTYIWTVNGLQVGGNSPSFASSTLNNGDVVQCQLTSSAPCASPATVLSNSINVVIAPLTPPAISIAAAQTVLCPGVNASLWVTSVTKGGTNPSYQWKVNGVNVGTNSDSLTITGFANGSIISCVLTSNDPCVSAINATSNPITFVVKNQFTPVVTLNAPSATTFCAGSQQTFTATATFTGALPVYSWQVNGTTVFSGSNTFVTTSLQNGDVVTCTMQSSSSLCLATNPTVSTAYTANVQPTVTPSVSIVSNKTTVCSGDFINFIATPVNEGSLPTYQWLRNGIPTGAGTSNWTTNSLGNNDVISVILNSSLTCLTQGSDTSNGITITVLPIDIVSATIVASRDTICVGNNINFTVAAVNNPGSTPSYQWTVNGANVASTSTSYSSTALQNGDVVACNVTSSVTCPSVTPAQSNQITITVFQPATPNITITASDVDICIGENVVFNSNVVDEGTSPTYQWFWNGNLLNGSTATTYSNPILENTDQIYCVMLSNANCLTKPGDTSNVITMSVADNITPEISITQSPAYAPVGASITYTANTTVLPTYSISWYRNGILSVTTNNTPLWTTNAITATDSVYAIIGGFTGCYLGNSAVSNTVGMAYATSVGDMANANFAIYPNPVTSTANISGVESGDDISVYDVAGKLLANNKVNLDGTYAVDMQAYAKGIYQVRIMRGNAVQVLRVVKE